VSARVTWLGHATALLDVGGALLLTDPLLRGRFAHLVRRAPPARLPRRVDAVLVSHLHHDHLDLPSLRAVGADVPIVVPRGAGAWLRSRGFGRVIEARAGDELDVAGVAVGVTHAEHDGGRTGARLRADAVGYLVGGIWFAGDTDLFAGMAELAGRVGLALVPVWGWGPSLGPGHLGPREAARAVALVRPRVAVPIHWGTYWPVGLGRFRSHLLSDPPRAFARLVAQTAPGVEVRVVLPGGAVDVPEPA
jgi:L-ascorbate metabolism protein UlaG (beta-lactamase superfamily)